MARPSRAHCKRQRSPCSRCYATGFLKALIAASAVSSGSCCFSPTCDAPSGMISAANFDSLGTGNHSAPSHSHGPGQQAAPHAFAAAGRTMSPVRDGPVPNLPQVTLLMRSANKKSVMAASATERGRSQWMMDLNRYAPWQDSARCLCQCQ